MKTQQTNSRPYVKGEFIPDLDDAHARIHELDRLLGQPLSNLDKLYNIDTANEEIERLEKRVESKSAPSSQLKPAPSSQSKPTSVFKSNSGMAKLIAAIEASNKR